MNQITPRPVEQKTPKDRFTPKERAYYAWLHDDPMCCVTGQTFGIEIAHTGPKAMAMKAPLATCLPITWKLHKFEERNRDAFWAGVGFPDHLAWAERLMDMFETGRPKETVLDEMVSMANRPYILEILGIK